MNNMLMIVMPTINSIRVTPRCLLMLSMRHPYW